MPTKQHPGVYDCYKSALPDEPIFVILGRDPAGPATLEFWAEKRIKLGKVVADDDKDRIRHAIDEAKEMQDWRDRMMEASVDGVPPWRLQTHFIGESEELRPSERDTVRIVSSGLAQIVADLRDLCAADLVKDGHQMKEDMLALSDRLSGVRVMLDNLELTNEVLKPAPIPYLEFPNVTPSDTMRRSAEAMLHAATRLNMVDENTPADGDKHTDVRRGVIWALKRLLGHIDIGTAPPTDTPRPVEQRFLWTDRLANIDRRSPLESKVFDLIEQIESVGAHPDLTMAVSRLTEAVCALGHWADTGYPGLSAPAVYPGTKIEKPPVIDTKPDDLAHAPEVPHHRFSAFHVAGAYAYARGLEINPQHLPVALDAMLKSGWRLLSIFGQTDSQHIGFIFKRAAVIKTDPPMLDVPALWHGTVSDVTFSTKAVDLYKQGAPFEEIAAAVQAERPCGADGRGRGLEP